MGKYWTDYQDTVNMYKAWAQQEGRPANTPEIVKGDPLQDPEFRIIAHEGYERCLIRHESGQYWMANEYETPMVFQISNEEAKIFLERWLEPADDRIAQRREEIEQEQKSLKHYEETVERNKRFLSAL